MLRRAQQHYPADFWLTNSVGCCEKLTPPESGRRAALRTAAVALRPDSPGAHNNLGSRWGTRASWTRPSPATARPSNSTRRTPGPQQPGQCAEGQGPVGGGHRQLQKAIDLDPKFAGAHNNLGNALAAKGQLEEAIACYRKAIDLDPKFAKAHGNLGNALRAKGQLDEAIASYQQGHRTRPEAPAWHAPGLDWLRRPNAGKSRQGKLPALLKGDFKPTTNDERLALAGLCTIKNCITSSAGLYADAFAADPKLADDLQAGHRYNAACFAALAAAGQGEDAAKLDDNGKGPAAQAGPRLAPRRPGPLTKSTTAARPPPAPPCSRR